MFDLSKILGIKLDPKKVNEAVQFSLAALDEFRNNSAELVKLQKENNNLLRELIKKGAGKNG